MKLGININYIASLRNAMGGAEPDLIRSTRLCEHSGAQAISVYYDGLDSNVTKSDILAMKRVLKCPLIMMVEMNEKSQKLAIEVKPDMVFIVPEKMGYDDFKFGYNVEKNIEKVNEFLIPLLYAGINAGVFVEPKLGQITAAYKAGAKCVEINARKFSETFAQNPMDTKEFITLKEAVVYARTMGMDVNISGGINYKSIEIIREIPTVKFVNVGHSIITKAIFDGLTSAVKQMLFLVENKD